MAYVDAGQSGERRAGALVAVGAIHAIMAIGLVTGLHTTVIETVEKRFTAGQLPADPPPPEPEPEPRAEPNQPQISQIVPPMPPLQFEQPSFEVPPREFDDSNIVVPVPTPTGLPGDSLLPTPTPSPSASFNPIRPTPRNDASRWVTANDYPSRDLRMGNTGVSTFRVVVGTDGKVDACEITGSSGHARLDAATCKNVSRRARFDAARDNRGEKVVGTYTSSVRWVIPD